MIFIAQTSAAIDHRLALVIYVALMLAAAGAVVCGWLRVLPAEREPFAVAEETVRKTERDAFAIFLLANVTLSVLLRIPGVDSGRIIAGLMKWLPAEWAKHGAMIALIWFGFIPVLAAAYSLVRKNPLRWPLVVGGAITVSLWLAAPLLLDSIRGTN